MPKFQTEVEVPGKSAQELFDKVADSLGPLLEKAQIGKVEVDKDPDQKLFRIDSKMLSGDLACKEGRLRLDANLSFLAAPFKSKIQEMIEKWVRKTFP